MWITRHGERVDEVVRKWQTLPEYDGWEWYDPPLTPKGQIQGVQAGNLLKEQLQLQGIKFESIYVSPFSRTLMTAEGISDVLQQPVDLVVGVSECCVTVKQLGMTNMIPKFAPVKSIDKFAPKLKINQSQLQEEKFEDAAERLAIPGKHILLVTHREGVRNISRKTPTPVRDTPYCITVHFTFNIQTGEWAVVEQFRIPK